MDKYTVVKRSAHRAIYGRIDIAKRNSDGGMVAMKMINKERAIANRHGKKKQYEDPLAEVSMMRAISDRGGHPCLLGMEDLFETDKYIVLVTPFKGKGELYAMVDDAANSHEEETGSEVSRGLHESGAQSLFLQLLLGLKWLFDHDIVHRDISLENMVVDDDNQLFLMDFGQAIVAKHGVRLTSFGCGKTTTAAPEVMAAREPYDPRKADMWSAGMSLFIVLTGMSPIDYPLPSDERFKYIAAGKLKLLMDHWGFSSYLSSAAVDLLTKMLNVDATQRLSVEQVLSHPWVQDAIGKALASGDLRMRAALMKSGLRLPPRTTTSAPEPAARDAQPGSIHDSATRRSDSRTGADGADKTAWVAGCSEDGGKGRCSRSSSDDGYGGPGGRGGPDWVSASGPSSAQDSRWRRSGGGGGGGGEGSSTSGSRSGSSGGGTGMSDSCGAEEGGSFGTGLQHAAVSPADSGSPVGVTSPTAQSRPHGVTSQASRRVLSPRPDGSKAQKRVQRGQPHETKDRPPGVLTFPTDTEVEMEMETSATPTLTPPVIPGSGSKMPGLRFHSSGTVADPMELGTPYEAEQ